MLPLTLQPVSDRPIYAQIVDQVAFAIRAGQVSPGEALPSVRDIAARLAVNPNTVAKAYAQLEAAGLVRDSETRLAGSRGAHEGSERGWLPRLRTSSRP